MLIPAIVVEEDLKEQYKLRSMDEDLKWYHAGYTEYDLEIVTTDWKSLQMASVKDNKLMGYFGCTFDRECYYVSNLSCLSFSKSAKAKAVFASDLRRFLKILVDRKFKKINWSVIIGNPIEAVYDRIAKKVGARIVGTFKNDVLVQGDYHDRKFYEWINDYYECTHCGHKQKKEEEITCWKCGLGEMVYHNPFVW